MLIQKTTRIEHEYWETLESIKKENGTAITTMVNEAISDYLEKHPFKKLKESIDSGYNTPRVIAQPDSLLNPLHNPIVGFDDKGPVVDKTSGDSPDNVPPPTITANNPPEEKTEQTVVDFKSLTFNGKTITF